MPAPLRRLLGRPFSFEPQTVCREHGGANDRLCMYRHRHTRAVLRRPRPLPYRQRPQRHLHQHDADAAIHPGGPAPRRSFPLELRRHERRLFVGFSAAGHFQATESYSSLFIFATLGNFVAIILAFFNWKTLTDRNTPLLDKTPKQFRLRQLAGIGILIGLVPVVWFMLQRPGGTETLIKGICAAVALTLIYLTIRHNDRRERRNMTAYLILTIGSLMFWSLYQMAPSGLMLFAINNVDLMIGPAKIQPQWIQNINTVR